MKKNPLGFENTVQQIALRIALFLGAAFATSTFLSASARADTYVFSTLVGNAATLDHTDGVGSNARFFNPTGIAVDSAGTIYVADGGDHTVRRVTAAGVVSTFAGASGQAGSVDGTGSGARFVYPFAVATDAAGNVYVTDVGDHTVRRITPGGSVATLAGTAGVTGSVDGLGTSALLNYPEGVAADAAGNIYISDTGNSTIRKIAINGVVSTFAGAAGQNGTADGNGAGARFNYQAGLAIDTAGNLYVADQGNSTVRKIDAGGNVSTLAGAGGQAGNLDGVGGNARFDHPTAVSVDAAGNVYVMDTSNQTVRKISIATGAVTTLAGTAGMNGNVDGAGAIARFFYPFGIAVTATGSVYVADTGNHTIRTVSATGAVGTLAGSVGLAGVADGSGTSALFAYPAGIAVDSAGTIYVADHNNNTVRKIAANGSVTTLAGTAGLPGSTDGAGAIAKFNGLTGVAVDGSGNVYVADAGNSTIRKITAGGIVSTFAGVAGVAGSSDGVGTAARFNAPQGIATDAAGNVYVADTNNSTIRKITSAGVVTTLAGVAGQTGTGDGAGGSARFNGPYAVTVDSAGNVYVADFFNATIRQITPTGVVSTIAGWAGHVGAADGFGTLARFNQPYAIAADASGNVFVADTGNREIRKVTPLGVVTTVNGSSARFYYPQGLALDRAGNLYVADGDNQSISKGLFIPLPPSGTVIADQTIGAGGSATFSVAPALAQTTYQWQVSNNGGLTWTTVTDGANYTGSGSATLSVVNATAALSGSMYRAQLSNLAGSSNSGIATLTVAAAPPPTGGTGVARLINLSVRTQVGTGANAVVVGFAISGTGAKQMLIRGIGPGLTQFNVTGYLATPSLTLFNSANTAMASNTAWGGSAAMSAEFGAVGAFSLPPTSNDTALYQALPAGTYTAEIAGVSNSTGIGLAEFYDADSSATTTRLSNVSARAVVGSGANSLVAGFVISGTGTETVLIRGIGPGLAQFNVTGALAAPQLTLYNSTNVQIGGNTGWGGTAALTAAFKQVGAFPIDPTSADCAILVTLPAGTYTAQISSGAGPTGLGLIEVYEIR